ncbi:NAD-dependent epimerase/dehydratase family protein [Thermodesulfobacteriota bacterium]
MNTLITGAQGFTGSVLIEQLRNESGTPHCTDVRSGKMGNGLVCDLTNADDTIRLLDTVQPDRIYHLAGSFANNYAEDYAGNVLCTKNILSAVVRLARDTRVLLIGSAAEYGRVAAYQNPIRESQPLRPISMYGLTKTMQTILMRYFIDRHDLDVLMARPFNLFGKGLSDRLFVGHIYRQIEQFRNKDLPSITVGKLNAVRDYIDVQEATKWYRKIMNHGKRGEIYNVGSGKPVSVSDVLDRILSEENIDSCAVRQSGPVKSEIEDVDVSYADISKLLSLAK